MAKREVVLLGSQANLLLLAQERRDREVAAANGKFMNTIAPVLEECRFPKNVDLSWHRGDSGELTLSADVPDISPQA